MGNKILYESTLTQITETSTSYEIPCDVEIIGSNCISSSSPVKNITFQSSSKLLILESYAFSNSNIQTISLKECKQLENISFFCFFRCGKLESIELPLDGRLKIIQEGSFSLCKS